MAEWVLNNLVRPLFDGTIYICQHNICPPFCRCLREIFESFSSDGRPTSTDKKEGETSTGQPGVETNTGQPGGETGQPGDQANNGQIGGQTNTGGPGGGTNTVESSSGARTLSARALEIEHADKTKDTDYWKWKKYPSEPRFKEALMLKYVYWLEITAWMNLRDLTSNTNYAAYLIYRTDKNSVNLDTIQKALISVGGKEVDGNNVCIKPATERAHNGSIGLPEERDGWMELKLGQFNCDIARDVELKITIKRTEKEEKEEEKKEGRKKEEKEKVKTGLIVAAIEVRPV